MNGSTLVREAEFTERWSPRPAPYWHGSRPEKLSQVDTVAQVRDAAVLAHLEATDSARIASAAESARSCP